MNKTAFITHPSCLQHDTGSGHPESPERLMAITEQLEFTGLHHQLSDYDAPMVKRECLERAHTKKYVDSIGQNKPSVEGEIFQLDADTQMSYHSFEAANRAAGAIVLATDLVLAGEVNNAFCAVRPPGHHAKRDAAMGFCIYNNIMVGVYHALASGFKRVALLDFDVHHGNGSENIIADDDRILFCSTFQHPYYPYEPCQGNEHVICSPLSAGAGSEDFRTEVTSKWIPALEQFQPQMIFISAGFDAHEDDYLANLNFTEDDYYWVTEKIVNIAYKYAAGRIVSSLEGGYNTKALANSVEVHLLALLDK